jgi:hypothetical protein
MTPLLNNLTEPMRKLINLAKMPTGSAPQLCGAVVVVEDDKDIANEIEIAMGKVGLLILIGEPNFDQKASEFSPTSVLKVSLAIAIGEVPVLWRTNPSKPKAKDVALLLTQLLHNQKFPGFQNLKVDNGRKVPNKTRNLYELTLETAFTAPQL